MAYGMQLPLLTAACCCRYRAARNARTIAHRSAMQLQVACAIRSTPQLAAAASGLVATVKSQPAGSQARGAKQAGLMSAGFSNDDAALHAAVTAAMTVEAESDQGQAALRLLLLSEARVAVLGQGLEASDNDGPSHHQLGGVDLLSVSAFEEFVWSWLCSRAHHLQHANQRGTQVSGFSGGDTSSSRSLLRGRKTQQRRLRRTFGVNFAPTIVEWILSQSPVATGSDLVATLGRTVEAVRLHASHSLAVEQLARLCSLQVCADGDSCPMQG